MPVPKKSKAKPRSLVAFVRDKARAKCPVCRLPIEVRAELKTASEKHIRRDEQLEWLATEHRVKITVTDLATHNNARHDV